MRPMRLVTPIAAVALGVLLGFTSLVLNSSVRAESDETESAVQIGFQIAPVKLNLQGKNRALVGKGSYIVNAKSTCNSCHNSPQLGGEFALGGNPFFGQPASINKKGYLAGGETFGPFPGEGIGGAGPLLVFSRNLTPDVTGLPVGGTSLDDFFTIIRTGHDFDGAHPACPVLGVEGCIISPPFNAGLLQVMPWPAYAKMSDNDIHAIYEYLSAIPCVSHQQDLVVPGVPPVPDNLKQTCP